MKREYRKPYLAVESFQLDAAIAGSCAMPIHYAENTCKSYDEPQLGENEEDVYFVDACTVNVIDSVGSDSNDTSCYHGPVIDLAKIYLTS